SSQGFNLHRYATHVNKVLLLHTGPVSKPLSSFSKPGFGCEHRTRRNYPFTTLFFFFFFFKRKSYFLHCLSASIAFHLPCLKKGRSTTAFSNRASSGTVIAFC
uniref:Uncharacterized protein n=1 Tax=Apteryx owenii TaxID=8824 RepID=A0A8B9S4U3_APTOW